MVDFLFAHVPLLALPGESGRRRRPTLGQHLRDIAHWTASDGATTPHVLAARHDRVQVLARLNMAALMEQAPTLPAHELVVQLALYGLHYDDRDLDRARKKLMKFLKKSFGMQKNPLPLC